jgi:hypothetical protein
LFLPSRFCTHSTPLTTTSGDRFTSVLVPIALVAASFAMLTPGAATMYVKPGKNA